MPLRSGGRRMNLDECLEELQSITDSVTKREIKVKWSDGVVAYYSVEDFTGFPDETVLCSSQGDFFLRTWNGEGLWLSASRSYSSEELFDLLLRASKNRARLYATSTDAILEGLQK